MHFIDSLRLPAEVSENEANKDEKEVEKEPQHDTDAQFLYLDSMFEASKEKLSEMVSLYAVLDAQSSEDKERVGEYIKLTKVHFELLCKKKPSAVVDAVRVVKKGKALMSVSECLEICQAAK